MCIRDRRYPLGSPERTAIAQAWVEVMRALCVASLLVQLPALVMTFCVPELDLHDPHTHRRRHTDVEHGDAHGSAHALAPTAPLRHGKPRSARSAHSAHSARIPSPPWRPS